MDSPLFKGISGAGKKQLSAFDNCVMLIVPIVVTAGIIADLSFALWLLIGGCQGTIVGKCL